MTKTKIALSEAEAIANKLIAILAPYCERIEIAGSIRRKKPEVGDIEIVTIPKMFSENDLFGALMGRHSALDDFDYSQIGTLVKGGSRYKQIELTGGISLDLFIVLPPAQWGVIFMIRTGPDTFSKRMVKQINIGGYLPSIYSVKDGVVVHHGGFIPMPEEKDYFDLCGMMVIPPEQRQ